MELEVKYKLNCFPKQQIIQMGFVEKGTSHQIDKYYIVDKVLSEKRTYLRVREDVKQNEFSLDFHQIISELATDEIEVQIKTKEDCDKFDKIFFFLGYPYICTINKQRQIFEKDGIKIVFDIVQNLGDFIEIELIGNETEENTNKLLNIISALALNDADIISNKGYPDLMIETMNAIT